MIASVESTSAQVEMMDVTGISGVLRFVGIRLALITGSAARALGLQFGCRAGP